jgi:asparagine N-glycosylation enzyme membrane subunit Stt3
MNNDQPSNDYDFILNPEKNKPSRLPSGGSQNKRLLQVAIGGVGLLIIFVVIIALFSGSSSSPLIDFYKLAAKQNDMIAITTDATKNSQNTTTLNNAATIRAVLTSQNTQTTAILAKLGQKKPTKLIAKYADNKYVNQLQLAFNGGTYDATYDTLMTARLGDYAAAIQTTYTATKSTATQKQLRAFFDDSQALAQNIPKN